MNISVWRRALGHGVVCISGAIPQTASHRHHAVQVSVARHGVMTLDDGVSRRDVDHVIIRADSPHSLCAEDALTLLIDPESHLGRSIDATWLGDAPMVWDVDALTSIVGAFEVEDVLACLSVTTCQSRHVDARIASVLSWLDDMAVQSRWCDVSLTSALRVACLSESRFLHLFSEHTGVTWRRMIIWRRALVAGSYVVEGMSMTEAAHTAGYSDSAHFSRQFKATFGFPPSVFAHALDRT